jgi:putative addiction module component (TIGR02574 family)
MEQNISELLEHVLKLSAEERAFLAASLLESLDETVDSDAEAAWEAEVLKRLEELDSGAVKPTLWADARRGIFGK